MQGLSQHLPSPATRPRPAEARPRPRRSRQLVVASPGAGIDERPQPARRTKTQRVDQVAAIAHQRVGGGQRAAVELDHADLHQHFARASGRRDRSRRTRNTPPSTRPGYRPPPHRCPTAAAIPSPADRAVDGERHRAREQAGQVQGRGRALSGGRWGLHQHLGSVERDSRTLSR